MQRFISISMAVVLAGWLAIPVAGAHFSPCDMKCCHRPVAVPHCSHMEDMTASGRAGSGPEIHASSRACPGKCCVKGRSIQFGLAAPGFDYLLSVPQISPQPVSFLDHWLRADSLHAGRAPPHAV
jgi:hypothetical protein